MKLSQFEVNLSKENQEMMRGSDQKRDVKNLT